MTAMMRLPESDVIVSGCRSGVTKLWMAHNCQPLGEIFEWRLVLCFCLCVCCFFACVTVFDVFGFCLLIYVADCRS